MNQKRILLLTASHSFGSSPGGSRTASLRFPLPRVASMCFRSCAPWMRQNSGRKIHQSYAAIRKSRNRSLCSMMIQKEMNPRTCISMNVIFSFFTLVKNRFSLSINVIFRFFTLVIIHTEIVHTRVTYISGLQFTGHGLWAAVRLF